MALIGNRSVIHKSPGRFLNGTANAGAGIGVMRSAFNKHGMMRNAYEGYDPKSATPVGHLAPSAWVPPKTAGGMSSRNVTTLQAAPTGLAYGGITTTGTADITISFADATGALIASGGGTAAMTFNFANALLTASLGGIGSASFTISTNTAQLGAEASGEGAALFAITGALIPYAIGSMSGTTVDNTTLTTTAIIAAMNASPPAVNIKKVNDVTVNGTGVPGDTWGP